MTTALKSATFDASPDEPVETWPFEGVLAAVERGTFQTGPPGPAIRADPWGHVASRVLRGRSPCPVP